MRKIRLKKTIPYNFSKKHIAYIRRCGDCVTVELGPGRSYEMEIRGIEKGSDDASMDISAY